MDPGKNKSQTQNKKLFPIMEYGLKRFVFVILKQFYWLKNQVLPLTGNTSPIYDNGMSDTHQGLFVAHAA